MPTDVIAIDTQSQQTNVQEQVAQTAQTQDTTEKIVEDKTEATVEEEEEKEITETSTVEKTSTEDEKDLLQDLKDRYGLQLQNLYAFRNMKIELIHIDENFTGLEKLPNAVFFKKRNATHISNFFKELEQLTGKQITQIRYHTDYQYATINKVFFEDLRRKSGYQTWMITGFINDTGKYRLSQYIASGTENMPKFDLVERINEIRRGDVGPIGENDQDILDECKADYDCNDNVACTRDRCHSEPKVCENYPITSCDSGDGCCPSGCSSIDDSDC